MIQEIQFTVGPDRDAAPLRVGPASVTVLVGPNNSGKSQALRDIEAILQGRSQGDVVQAVASKVDLSVEELVREIVALGGRLDGIMLASPPGLMPMVNGTMNQALHPVDASAQRTALLHAYHTGRTMRLDGTTRLQLTNAQPAGDLREPPKNIPRLLVDSPALRRRLRELLLPALDLHLIVTHTDQVGSFELRLSPHAPTNEDEELGVTQAARAFRERSRPMSEFSDGVRAFVGILAAQLAPQYSCILIDEPEAFLHPSLTRRLGFHLARLAESEGRSVVAATHSADFLLGCVDAGCTVDVVRLTFSNERMATARSLPAAEVRSLTRKPILRSANVLSALFHAGAVVCEGDSDRAFYQEINHRLLESTEGVAHTAFLSVNGKGSSPIVLAPLRALGVPAAAIVDFDALRDAASSFASLMEAARVPEQNRRGIGQTRGELWSAIDRAGLKDRAKKEGIAALAGLAEVQRATVDLIEQVETYGVFVVPVGEVEGWLGSLGVVADKSAWTAAMLERLGSDSAMPDYVSPTDGDVWAFLRKVARWIDNPARKGTHA